MRVLVSAERLAVVGQCPWCLRETTFIRDAHLSRPPLGFLFFGHCTACTRGLIAEIEDQPVAGGGKVTKVLSFEPRPRREFPDPDYEKEVPERLRLVLGQVYAAEKEQAWTLVGIGCRLVIERLAVLHGQTDGTLAKKLESLKNKFPGLAGPLENAEAVRLVGNTAAHDSEYDLQEAEAKAAIEFVEEILRDVYVLPAKRRKTITALPPKKS